MGKRALSSPVRWSRSSRTAATVTIREVAQAAQVSVATVSRVLNGKGPVREETRARIRRAVERLRYAPHGAARSLITRKTHTLGVLLPDLYGEFFSELIRVIDSAARSSGYHLLVSGSHGSRREMETMLRAIRGRVDGLIVLSPDLDAQALESNLPSGLPVVLLNGRGRHSPYDSIQIDNYGGAVAMVRHLIRLGYQRLVFVTGPSQNHDAAERLRGFRDAVRRRPEIQAQEIPGDFREEAGYRAAKRALDGRSTATAVFAANDAMAIGLLCALRERQLRVPEEVALAGFDDIPIARFITPALTTVQVPIGVLGARATAHLVHTLQGNGRRQSLDTILPTTLVVRASCGARARAFSTPRRKRGSISGPSTSSIASDSSFVTDPKEVGR